MPSKYEVDTKAEALALVRLGKPAKTAAIELGLPVRTVQEWAQDARQAALEDKDGTILDQDYHVTVRTGELLSEAIEELAESDEKKYKYLVPLNIVRGTHLDKILKRKELQQKERQTEAGQALADAINRLASLSVPELHGVIEGEAEEIEDA